MIITGICDACGRVLNTGANAVHIISGELVHNAGSLSLRSTKTPRVFNFCDSCVAPVQQVAQQVMRQRGSTPA